MPKEDWRERAAYDYAATLEPSGLAWEFLRRNPEYRGAYRSAASRGDPETSGSAQRWGLRFFR